MSHDRLHRGGSADVGLPRARTRAKADRGVRGPPRNLSALLRRARVQPTDARDGRRAERHHRGARPPPRATRGARSGSVRWAGEQDVTAPRIHVEGGDLLQQDAIRSVVREIYAGVRPTDGAVANRSYHPVELAGVPTETVRI